MLNNVGILNNYNSLTAFLIGVIFIALGMSACSDKSLSVEDEPGTLNKQITGVNVEGGG